MQPALQVVPLGGLGEFGMNSMAVSTERTTIVIDAGVMFAGPELPGVDLLIPDMTYLQQCQPRPAALVLTHGHEDHIGGVPYVWPLIDGPVYGSPLTLALVRPKLEEHGIDPGDRLVAVQPRQRLRVGDCELEFLRVTHSIPDCLALAIHTASGTIVHTGDFKIDQTPIDGQHFDLHRFAELGSAGVLALFADSTNIDRKGFTGSEIEVKDAFEEIFTTASGKLLVTTFASSVYRMQILVDLAEQFGRKVAFVGRGMLQTSEAAQRLGYLKLPAGRVIRDSDVESQRPSQVLCLTTGSQGEPFAALSRIAIDDHRYVKVAPDDTVVFSARVHSRQRKGDRACHEPPGSPRRRRHLRRHQARSRFRSRQRRGAEADVDCWFGPGSSFRFTASTGSCRCMRAPPNRSPPASNPPVKIMLLENGDVLRFEEGGATIAGKVPAGRVLIDASGSGEVIDEVLRDRRHLSEDGLLVPVVAINKQTGEIEGDADVISRGIAQDGASADLLRESARLVGEVIHGASVEERTDQGLIKEKIRVELRRFFRKRSGRRPLIVPVIMEV